MSGAKHLTIYLRQKGFELIIEEDYIRVPYKEYKDAAMELRILLNMCPIRFRVNDERTENYRYVANALVELHNDSILSNYIVENAVRTDVFEMQRIHQKDFIKVFIKSPLEVMNIDWQVISSTL